LETDVLTVDTIPLHKKAEGGGLKDEGQASVKDFHPSAFIRHPLFSFLMASVFATATTELAELQTLGRGLLVLGRRVVATLAITTLKHNIIARHNLTSLLFVLWNFKLRALFFVLCTLLSRFGH
jgi:hypothetical protein